MSVEEFRVISKRFDEEPRGILGTTFRIINFVPAVLVLLPLRVGLCLIFGALCWSLCNLALLLEDPRSFFCCCRKKSRDAFALHSRAQRCVLYANAFVYRLILFAAGFWWISVERVPQEKTSEDVPPRVAPSVVANHVMPLDAFFIAYLLGGHLTGVAKEWTTRAPVFSSIAKAHHILAVGGDARSRKKVFPTDPIEQVSKTSTDQIAEYQNMRAEDPNLPHLLIFPEGTTKVESCLLQFRTGAFVSGQPVQPVALSFPHTHVDISWVQGLPAYLFRLLTQWVNRVKIVWLPIYVPNAEERANPKLYAANVQNAIAVALQLPPERVTATIGPRELAKSQDEENVKQVSATAR